MNEEIEDVSETIMFNISGEIVMSNDPGKTIRKWREEFNVTQKELSNKMHVNTSVISDYETGRRKSPGSQFLKSLVHAMLEIDEERGSPIRLKYSLGTDKDVIIDIKEFFYDVEIEKFIRLIHGTLVSKIDVKRRSIRGYTILDSLNAILKLTSFDYFKVYGWTTERALFFTNVEFGRSPMIAVRVHPIKPAVVVYIQPKRVDPLAVKLAEVEKIPLITTDLSPSEIKEKLKEV
ncbi:MAG: helix-turn-helix domain-containing protein [Thermoplasmatales archaeon]